MTAATADQRDLAPAFDEVDSAAVHSSAGPNLLADLFASTSPAETLQKVVNHARHTFDCDGAGVVLTGRNGSLATFASGADAAQADGMQVEHHQGPAFGAIASWEPVVSPELRFDSRWRFWAPKVADLGFRSLISLALVDSDPFGALTLYSRRPHFFRAESVEAELTFAQHASIAITVAVEREQLAQARDSRGVVGQAQGILMERYQIGAEQAFALLRRYSSHLNQKLRLVAEQVVSHRELPDLDRIGLPA